MATQRIRTANRADKTRAEDREGAISQSVPANFGSRQNPPPTPRILPSRPPPRPEPMPELVIPGQSPVGQGILDRSTQQGSFSLTNDTSPLATMSLPVQSGFASRNRAREDDDMPEIVGSLKILTIIDESEEMKDARSPLPPEEQQQDDVDVEDDAGDDDDGVFEMDDDDES